MGKEGISLRNRETPLIISNKRTEILKAVFCLQESVDTMH